MRICNPIKFRGEIIARLLWRLQLCMKHVKCGAGLGQAGAKHYPEICHELAEWQQASSWLVSSSDSF